MLIVGRKHSLLSLCVRACACACACACVRARACVCVYRRRNWKLHHKDVIYCIIGSMMSEYAPSNSRKHV